MTGIYKITNKLNGKVYIGQATNLETRLQEHKKKRFVPIDMIINIFGVENFDFDILEECPKEVLDEKEKQYIIEYNSKEDGYNKQDGGMNNAIGEGNGRAILTEDDVIAIRTAYANHTSPKLEYEKYKDKITFSQFQAVWQGRSWGYIMPEVYTEENKKYYRAGQFQEKASLDINKLFEYRKKYVNLSRDELYQEYLKDIKGTDNLVLKPTSFIKIITGDVRKDSIYNTVPVYKKMKKTWELNGEPVQTIPESWE